jgi:hypothetical protein
MFFRCSGKELDVFVTFGVYLGVGGEYGTLRVLTREGNQKPRKGYWRVAKGGRSLFGPTSLLKSLEQLSRSGGGAFLIEAQPEHLSSSQATFDLAGLADAFDAPSARSLRSCGK